MCYFLQSTTRIIFRLQTQQVLIWSFASINLPSNLCSGSIGFCARTHWVYNDSGYNSCQLLLTAREFALANLPCTKPAAPLPSSSTWAMLNRIPIEKWGPDSSPRPPFLLQAMNPSFHGHSAILWSPRGLMDAKVWEGVYEERQTWSPRTRNNMRAPSIATDSGSAAYWPEHASWLAKTVQTHDGCFSQISAKG